MLLMMKTEKRAVLLGAALLGFAASAGTIVDFSQRDAWTPDFGRFADPVEARTQCVRKADGLHYLVDRARDDGRAYSSLVAVGRPMIFTHTNQLIRFVMEWPRPSPIGTWCALKFRDRDGEYFQYRPTEVKRFGREMILTFFVCDGRHQGETWGTKKLNQHWDGPIEFTEFNFNWGSASRGEIIFKRIETAAPTARTTRSVESVLPLVTDKDRYAAHDCTILATNDTLVVTCPGPHCWIPPVGLPPGPNRWHGPDAMVLKTSGQPPAGGRVELALRAEQTGKWKKFNAPWTSETRFETKLPYDRAQYLGGLAFAFPKDAPQRTFTILGMDAEYVQTAAEAFRLDVDTGHPLHIINAPGQRAVARITNPTAAPAHLGGTLRVSAFEDAAVFEIPLDRTLAAGETLSVPLPSPLPRKGIWHVDAVFRADDGSLAETGVQFAVLDRHNVTPAWPKGVFRPGVNYHIARYSRKDRELTLDAIVAMGGKLVRSDMCSFAQVCPKEGAWEWARQEELLAGIEEHGLAVDAIICTTPYWARPKEKQKPDGGKFRATYRVPPRKGLFGDFCQKLASRYGTRIAYYEFGNEWDLASEEVMTIDEGIALQREGYKGVHAGCADAVVIPNGWACPLESRHPSMRAGFQRRLMSEAQDAYDVYPIHLHGPYADYERNMRDIFAFRQEAGIKQPWYSNETALTSVNGAEDAVALCVWQKILFAWSHGSTDYIWYNLRGTGFDPKDGEQGYGLITGDFYPRAGYAAFSALTATFGELRATRLYADTAKRLVGRWEGVRNGAQTVVLAGWDRAAEHPLPIRVETDAAKAWIVDIMGNRTEVGIAAGTLVWPIGATPSALLVEGATRVEPVAADVAQKAVAAARKISVPAEKFAVEPTLVFDRFDQVVELYQADPMHADRTWKGPSDLSAKIWLAVVGGTLRVRAEATDDAAAAGDRLLLALKTPGAPLRKLPVPSTARTGTTTIYEGTFELGASAETARVGFVLEEDDGRGADGWFESVAGLGDGKEEPVLPALSVVRPPRRVMNVVNFVRGTPMFDPSKMNKYDVVAPLAGEIALNKKHGLKNTILLQYDALLHPGIMDLVRKSKDDLTEHGVWVEIPKPLIDAVGLPWHGRENWTWDWHVDPGFLMAYTHDGRRRIVDELMRKFKEEFGHYPASAGSWLLDAWSIGYMAEKYGVKAFCVCREQDNTDAYGLRGGYSNGAYYPSRKNMLSAATDMKNAVRAPVFKMLTPDPIFNYGFPEKFPNGRKPPTMEPVWMTGQRHDIVDWYYRTYLDTPALGFVYMQTGQENTFGWASIQKGLPYQLEQLVERVKKGDVVLETLGETGARFIADHPANIPQTQVALEDWSGNGYRSVWYNSRHYRANLLMDGEKLYFRDMHRMCDDFEEPYLDSVCTNWNAEYFTPPFVDEYMFKTNGASGVMTLDGAFANFAVSTPDAETLVVTATRKDGRDATVTFTDGEVRVEGATLDWCFDPRGERFAVESDNRGFLLDFRGFRYRVDVQGYREKRPQGWTIRPVTGRPVTFNFTRKVN